MTTTSGHILIPGTVPERRPTLAFWAGLIPGELVDVWRGPRWLNRSRVDALTDDGKVVWLVDEATGTRTLHLDTDGVALTRSPVWPAAQPHPRH